MRLEGCVRRDVMMDLEGPHAYCLFISIGLLSLKMMSADAYNMMMSAKAHNMMMSAKAQYDDEYECTQHDDECEYATHDDECKYARMMIRVFMRHVTLWGSTDLRT